MTGVHATTVENTNTSVYSSCLVDISTPAGKGQQLRQTPNAAETASEVVLQNTLLTLLKTRRTLAVLEAKSLALLKTGLTFGGVRYEVARPPEDKEAGVGNCSALPSALRFIFHKIDVVVKGHFSSGGDA